MYYVLMLILLVVWIGYAYLISQKAQENGLEAGEWFIKALFIKRTGNTLDNLIEHREAMNATNRVRNEYQRALDEQKAKEKKIEGSKVNYFNGVYNLSSDVRCIDITLTDQLTHLTATIRAKSYNKGIDTLKTTLSVKYSTGDVLEIKDMIFRGASIAESLWRSEDTKLTTTVPIQIADISSIDILVEKVIWSDFETENVNASENITIKDVTSIHKLKNVIGMDIVENYFESEKDWICYCGSSNALEVNICTRCQRDKSQFADIRGIDGLIDKLSKCNTLVEAKELILNYEALLGSELVGKVKEAIDKDIYVKRMYGMANEKECVEGYKTMISG